MSRWHIARLLPRRTVRLRLSLMYGALFVVSGAALLVITNLLVRHATGNFLFVQSTAPDGSTAGVISGQRTEGLAKCTDPHRRRTARKQRSKCSSWSRKPSTSTQVTRISCSCSR